MRIHENDCVRLKENITGPNCYGEGTVTKAAGTEGTAIAVFWDACDVEFDDNTFLTIPFAKLIKTWDVATGRKVA